MKYLKKMNCSLLLFCFLFFSCVENKEKTKNWDNSFLLMEKLYYKGLPLVTSKKKLVDTLGEPGGIEKKSSIQPGESGGFGDEIEFQVYIYYVGKGFISFSVYNDRALVYRIGFSDPEIVLEYEYGDIRLSGRLDYQQALTLFSATAAGITREGKRYQTLVFKSNSKSKMSAYATPLLTFDDDYLSELFYYPEFI